MHNIFARIGEEAAFSGSFNFHAENRRASVTDFRKISMEEKNRNYSIKFIGTKER